ncbi:uncharacterized protein SAPINGB_P001945 [Magnusiomyces paraingens]|uniref:SUN domain-containing protein n=1 Tax=Magnusiomyces paraingens TaxID=2606893 RepID=A0A5E8BJ80_9ASCO|nr:uncharacterized protein SAPINGB_P001945 [Saprochaete ingens]VVT48775.1 unnamed protein product [Saprochaete ingens]
MFSGTPISKRQNMNIVHDTTSQVSQPSRPIRRIDPADLSLEPPDPNAIQLTRSQSAAQAHTETTVVEALRFATTREEEQSQRISPSPELLLEMEDPPQLSAPLNASEEDSDSDLEPPPILESLKETQNVTDVATRPNGLSSNNYRTFDFDTSFVSPLKNTEIQRLFSTPIRTIPTFRLDLGPPQRTPDVSFDSTEMSTDTVTKNTNILDDDNSLENNSKSSSLFGDNLSFNQDLPNGNSITLTQNRQDNEHSDEEIYDPSYIDDEYHKDQGNSISQENSFEPPIEEDYEEEEEEKEEEEEEDDDEKLVKQTNSPDDFFTEIRSRRRTENNPRHVSFANASRSNSLDTLHLRQNNVSQQQETPVRKSRLPDFEFNSDEETAEETDVEDNKDSLSHTFSRSRSQSFSILETQEADDEIAIGIFKDAWEWIVSKVLLLKPLMDAVFSFSIIKLSISFLLFTIFFSVILFIFNKALITPTTYNPSPNPPSNINDLVDRLLSLESEVSRLSRRSTLLESSREEFYAQLSQVQQNLRGVSKEMDRVNKHLTNSERYNTEQATKLTNVEVIVSEIEKKLRNTQNLLNKERDQGVSRDAAFHASQRKVANMETLFSDMDSQIELLKQRVAFLEEAEKVEQVVLRTIDKVLPPKLIVVKDPKTGDITPTPEFWKFLQNTFESSIEKSPILERKVKQIVRDHPELVPLRPSKDISAEEFNESTQRAVKSFLKDYLTDQNKILESYPDSSALVTRDVFSQMLQRELENMREFTIDSLAALESKLRSNSKSSLQDPTSSLLKNGSTSALSALIKTSIDKYVKHTISKPDFADPVTGATINTRLTTPSFDWNVGLPFFQRKTHEFYNVLGFGRMRTQPPSVAFSSDTRLGSCWAFNGPTGRVALNLRAPIVPSDLGIVHISANMSSNPGSAPRRISLWAAVDDAGTRDRLRALVPQPDPKAAAAGELPQNYVQIVTAEYDLFGEDELQVFPMGTGVRQLLFGSGGVQRVVFSVESNWGNSKFTCVYQLRLFGDLVKSVKPIGPPVVQKEQKQKQKQEAFEEDKDEPFLPLNEDETEVLEDEFYINANELMPTEKGRIVVRGSLGSNVNFNPDESF